MHLLLIHQNFPGQFRDLAPAWLEQGHQVTALGSVAAPQHHPRWEGLTYLQYSVPGSEEPSAIERGAAVGGVCRQLIAQGAQPDLVLVHSGWGEARELRAVFPNTPLVVFPELWGHPEALGFGFDRHLDGQAADPSWFSNQNQLAAEAIAASDAALVPCAAQRSSFPSVLQGQLTLLPEGLALGNYNPSPSAEISVNGLRFRAGDPLVTLVSRTLEPLRGLRQALLAWPEISASHPSAQLLLVGELGGEGEGYGEEQPPAGFDHLSAALAGLPANVDRSRIHALGRLHHGAMLEVLRHSACHLALSYPYTLSWSVLEAMACAAPVISNHRSPIAPELEHGHNGLLVAFNDHRALSRASLALLNTPEQRLRLGEAGRRTIEERFSLSSSLASYQTLFDRLTQNATASNQTSRSRSS